MENLLSSILSLPLNEVAEALKNISDADLYGLNEAIDDQAREAKEKLMIVTQRSWFKHYANYLSKLTEYGDVVSDECSERAFGGKEVKRNAE